MRSAQAWSGQERAQIPTGWLGCSQDLCPTSGTFEVPGSPVNGDGSSVERCRVVECKSQSQSVVSVCCLVRNFKPGRRCPRRGSQDHGTFSRARSGVACCSWVSWAVPTPLPSSLPRSSLPPREHPCRF